MTERLIGGSFATGIDRFFRDENTYLAKAINGICSLQGKEYRNCKFKRGFEFVVTTPAAFLSIPIITILGLSARFEDGQSMFFIQERVGKGGKPVKVVKIRTMKAGSDIPGYELAGVAKCEPEEDPRNTALGQKIRAYELDELPQFFQILKGDISLVDIRCITQRAIENIRTNRPNTFQEWYEAYLAGKPGLLNLHSALNKERKNDLKRHYYDILYARKASLGLDLFIIYRTSLRMFRKVEEKIRRKSQNDII